MPEQVTFSRVGPVKDAVLVCIDDKKGIYKYIPLDQVKIQGETLQEFFTRKDKTINLLENRIRECEIALGINIDLAVMTAEGVSDDL